MSEKMIPIPIIETDRLTLRGFTPHDLDRLAEILSDPDVMRFMPGGQPFTRERTEANLKSILRHWDEHGFGWWAVIHNADACLIGWCGLTYLPELSETEVAYLYDRPYWNKGIGTEAAQASLRYGFEELELDHIVALAVPENIGSRRVMEKNSLVYETQLHLWGLDLAKYAITRDAFRPSDSTYTLQALPTRADRED
jgi:RimJ/RimL family protein N-acetyltransferase